MLIKALKKINQIRLEKEIERLNREIDDLKRRSREEENELVDEYKQRMAKAKTESDAHLGQLRETHK